MSWAIVEARGDTDFETLLAFHHEAFACMGDRIDPHSSVHRMTATTPGEKAECERLFLVRDGEQLVGCMFCREEADHLYVGKVAVSPKHQGRGIGRALIANAFVVAAGLGLAAMELETRTELIEIHRAFARLGFKKVGESAHRGYAKPTSFRMRTTVRQIQSEFRLPRSPQKPAPVESRP